MPPLPLGRRGIQLRGGLLRLADLRPAAPPLTAYAYAFHDDGALAGVGWLSDVADGRASMALAPGPDYASPIGLLALAEAMVLSSADLGLSELRGTASGDVGYVVDAWRAVVDRITRDHAARVVSGTCQLADGTLRWHWVLRRGS